MASRGLEKKWPLLRAADLIGQLGDPHYLKKTNALYYEFEEIGLNKQLGYETPADLVDKYPQFYWNSISPPHPGRYPLPERNLQRTPVDCRPLQQRVSCGALVAPFGATALAIDGVVLCTCKLRGECAKRLEIHSLHVRSRYDVILLPEGMEGV
jgi:hypothetical protein